MQSEQRLQLVSVEDTVWRAVCLGSLMFRAHLENELKGGTRPADMIGQIVGGLGRWMQREGVAAHLSKKESGLLSMPAGGWDEKDIADVTWRAEALGMIGWAISLVGTLPRWDMQFDVTPIVWSLQILEDLGPVRTAARMRPMEDLARAREVSEIWHWRARSDQLQRRAGLPPSPQALQAALEKAATHGAIQEPMAGDFPALGKPYRDLSPQDAVRVGTIAQERHAAMNWLCGYAQDWDRIPTDT